MDPCLPEIVGKSSYSKPIDLLLSPNHTVGHRALGKEIEMLKANRQFKDRLFRLIFGSEEYRDNALSLYNAVNHTSYTDASKLIFTTLDNAVYLGMKNDVSFLFGSDMNLYEQQSSFNPNMPLRMMQYAGNLYEKYIKENGLNTRRE